MAHELVVLDDVESVARRGAELIAGLLAHAAGDDPVRVAVSGGRTPWLMLTELVELEPELHRLTLFQVDERVAPDGSDDRNLTHLRAVFGPTGASVVPMPVDDPDLDAAAEGYAALLPARFDLVHLGLGADGHTASLVPDDPVLGVTDRLVAPTGSYQGHRRLTLTYPALARADRLLWVVTGAEKEPALRSLLAGDPGIPAGRVGVPEGGSTVLADRAAAGNPSGWHSHGLDH